MKKLSFACLYGFLLCTSISIQATVLISINHENSLNDQEEIDIFLSGLTKYNAFLQKSPNQLVIDFTNAVSADDISQLSLDHPSIKSINKVRKNEHDLRMIFNFKPGIEPVGFFLGKDDVDKTHLLLKLVLNSDESQAQQGVIEYFDDEPIATTKSYEIKDKSTISNKLLSDWDLSGKISVEELVFFHNKLDAQQHNNYFSVAIEPEFYREWDNGKQSFTFEPFFRYSQHDSRRTHFDIRELTWLLAEDDWELRIGFRKVFWGVAEGLHLVDIINQTDLIENNDTEDKLGQPMINLALIREWGTLDLFLLPGFRERTFPGKEGRLRTFPEVDVGNAQYEKHGIEKHLGYAVRWSQVISDWDVGFSHFYGTSREPGFKFSMTPDGSFKIIPYYELINQTGLDLQWTIDDWIFKHEAIVRSGQGKTFYANTTGIEYTLFDIFSSGLDLGLVVEYMYDTRGSNNTLAPFQDDFLTALRFAFNDTQSTEILAGVLFDRTSNTRLYNIEASRRIGESFKIDLEMRIFSGAPTFDSAYSFREDDHIRLDFSYYY